MTSPSAVVVREVGLRDGLQAISRTLPSEHKLAWLRAAHAAGLREIDTRGLGLANVFAAWRLDGEPLHGTIARAGLPRMMRAAA